MNRRNHVFSGRNAPIPFPGYFPAKIGKVSGCRVWDDESGQNYVDLWMGFGALLFGHADARSADAVARFVHEYGFSHSYCHDAEFELAGRLAELVPCAEFSRFAVTGQEATSYAVRMARAATGRERLLLVQGGYHGSNDATGVRSPAGIPAASTRLISLVAFGNIDAAAQHLNSGQYAAFMLEPVLGNNTVVAPPEGYLAAIRELCTRNGTMLIFDEVMTGFRNNIGGAQSDFGAVPDLATFGKALGGGVPISAICGSESAMSALYPIGPVAQEGTFYGSPLAVRMAIETIDRYRQEGTVPFIAALTDAILRPVRSWIEASGVPVCVSTYGGMFSITFIADMAEKDPRIPEYRFGRFVYAMWSRGFLYPPIPTESAFLSVAHENMRDHLAESLLAAVQEAVATTAPSGMKAQS